MDFLDEELVELLNIFREESDEIIQKLNENFLILEKEPQNKAVISDLFRNAHSLKGAARMIGFNEIQTLAHKIEDILGLAKDNQLDITSEIIDVLCKATDYIARLILISIDQTEKIQIPEYEQYVHMLENVNKPAEDNEESSLVTTTDFSKKNECDYKPLFEAFLSNDIIFLSEIKICLIKLAKDIENKNLIEELFDLFNLLNERLNPINIYELKEIVSSLALKIQFVIKGSGYLSVDELAFINAEFDKFVEFIELEIKKCGLDFEQAKNKIKTNVDEYLKDIEIDNNEFVQAQSTPINDEVSDLTQYIIDNITNLSQPGFDVKNLLSKADNIINLVQDINIKNVYLKVKDIVNTISQTPQDVDMEILNVIKQTLEISKNIVMDSKNAAEEDPQLLTQRLTILQQMIDLVKTEAENPTTQPVAVENNDVISKESKNINEEMLKPLESGIIKTLRVDTNKLDQLVNQIGELIIAKIKIKKHLEEIEKVNTFIEDWYRSWNKTKQYLKYLDKKNIPCNSDDSSISAVHNKNIYYAFNDFQEKMSGLISNMSGIHRMVQEDDARLNFIVDELERMVKGIRVLPLATVFHMFPRMVRDIAREKGKDIDLIITGSETSADKKIIEEIKSPLTHIIRNAIDHGIETPEERIAKGKNPQGKIILGAYHLENSILIEITDDGRGIDLGKIKEKVLEKGLLTIEELNSMPEEQIMSIIFWPGFSTGDSITDISGRGVGLDVVYTKITQLGGKVSVYSDLGQQCKVSIQLPLTMATVKSFLISVNNQTFALPTNSVKTALWVDKSDIFLNEGKPSIVVENKVIPIFYLSKILQMDDNEALPSKKHVVIVIESESTQAGFVIEKLHGDQEILHKKLNPPLIKIRNIAGVTTLASGELCLILNVTDLLKTAFAAFDHSNHQVLLRPETSKSEYKILVVDDSITTRTLEKNILKVAGYNVQTAINGLDALNKVYQEKFNLIISDVEMPHLTGYELAKRLKTDPQFSSIPIILVTSLYSEEARNRGMEAGASAYLTKGDFNQIELINTIEKCLQEGKHE